MYNIPYYRVWELTDHQLNSLLEKLHTTLLRLWHWHLHSGEFLQDFHLVIGLLKEDFHLTQCIKYTHEQPLPIVHWLCNKVAWALCCSLGWICSGKTFSIFKQDFKSWLRSHHAHKICRIRKCFGKEMHTVPFRVAFIWLVSLLQVREVLNVQGK